MGKSNCVECGKETVSLIMTNTGKMCYQCLSDKKNPPKQKKFHNNEEARIQTEFFSQVPLIFPKLPSKMLFAVPNGGSRNKVEAANMKRQGVKPGISDVILLIPNKDFFCLCLEFKTEKGQQSIEQQEFQQQIEKIGGKYIIVRSAIQAIEVMQEYLKHHKDEI